MFDPSSPLSLALTLNLFFSAHLFACSPLYLCPLLSCLLTLSPSLSSAHLFFFIFLSSAHLVACFLLFLSLSLSSAQLFSSSSLSFLLSLNRSLCSLVTCLLAAPSLLLSHSISLPFHYLLTCLLVPLFSLSCLLAPPTHSLCLFLDLLLNLYHSLNSLSTAHSLFFCLLSLITFLVLCPLLTCLLAPPCLSLSLLVSAHLFTCSSLFFCLSIFVPCFAPTLSLARSVFCSLVCLLRPLFLFPSPLLQFANRIAVHMQVVTDMLILSSYLDVREHFFDMDSVVTTSASNLSLNLLSATFVAHGQ